jgi:hypothetical protein
MAKPDNTFPITPAAAVGRLATLSPDVESDAKDNRVRNTELLGSILSITGLDHNSEAVLVRQAVVNALGRLPDAPE